MVDLPFPVICYGILSVQAPPPNPKRIILVNPTRYLGNLLIAGGLIQSFAEYCREQGIEFRLVIDEAFAGLLQQAFPPQTLILYPRRKIKISSLPGKARLYLSCLKKIRAFAADIAFNIEEDSVSHRLTQLSGARYRLGCSSQRHSIGYHHVLPISFSRRPADQQHRWYSFNEVFRFLGLAETTPRYLQLHLPELTAAKRQSLEQQGIDFSKPVAVLHTGATKLYKKWPHAHFARLADQLDGLGYQVVLIGAGSDESDISATLALLDAGLKQRVVNLLNCLSLQELAAFFSAVSLMVGNDSGPFHLAAAQNVPGVVIFGPTREDLWSPLSDRTRVLKDSSVCHPDCTRKHCLYQHRCLQAISPEQVISELQQLQS